MRGTFANNVNELLGRAAHGKGVYLRTEEEGLKVDIYCYLNYGVSVPKVALEMQDRVKQQVLFMTDIDLVEVNIHVVAVVPEKIPQPDLNELFPEDEDGEEMSKTELTRHEIREKALQALFPLDFNADLTKQDAIDYALAYDNREIVSEDGEDLVLRI